MAIARAIARRTAGPFSPKPWIVAALLLAGGAAGVAGADLFDGDGNDAPERTVTIAAPAAASTGPTGPTGEARTATARLTIDDGIPTAEARQVAAEAATHVVGGVPVSVDRDDGRYEVEVQRADGALVEVLLDGERNLIGVETD